MEYTVDRLAADAQFALVLLANEQSGDFELIDPAPVPPDTAKTYSARGLAFAGILGIVAGNPRTALEMPLGDAVIESVVQEFCRRVAYVRKHPTWVMPRSRA